MILSSAKAVIARHIKLLHDYNAIKDVGQGLMGIIADGRGVRAKEVQEDFGMEEGD
jgi:DNA repair protein Swi5/Sae3